MAVPRGRGPTGAARGGGWQWFPGKRNANPSNFRVICAQERRRLGQLTACEHGEIVIGRKYRMDEPRTARPHGSDHQLWRQFDQYQRKCVGVQRLDAIRPQRLRRKVLPVKRDDNIRPSALMAAAST